MNVTLLDIKHPPRPLKLSLFSANVAAGFPSPADDYIADTLDLNEYLVKHPSATFYARASGHSMVNAGILDGALLVVDRALEYRHGDIVIAAIDGELTCKVLDTRARTLRPANPTCEPIPLSEDMDCVVQGVVTYVINPLCTHL